MAGLDKMKEQILSEAKATASENIKKANEESEKILSKAKAELEKEVAEISKKSQVAVKSYQDRVISGIDLKRRTELLGAKQEVISEVLDKAYASIKDMETEEYFQLIKKLLEKYVQKDAGEIYFSKKDLDRIPSGFESEISKIAEEKGGKLTLASEAKNIADGFILVYGGIDENCTIKAMFDAKRDELSDSVYKMLFS
ncbi:MAG: hypothetical protein LBM02_01390 [Lachnospiraceae bacterium]|jgi:V/A-type H+-transporting ATPase subunit E|nr:hypothetical protein [Lachnospiraceae bacterium]